MIRLFISLLLLVQTQHLHARRASGPQTGVWRFEIQYPAVSVPFLLELEAQKKGWQAILINGKERVELGPVIQKKGRWIVALQTYQNYLEFHSLSAREIRGFFVKPNKEPQERFPILGRHGAFRRYDHKTKAETNLSGKWKMQINEHDGRVVTAIALLDQSGNTLNASIITPTGDYRYIDGYVSGQNFEAATFDGVYNFVFKGKLDGKELKGEITGQKVATFTAALDPVVELPDPLKQTSVEQLSFSFPDLDEKIVSLTDFRGKPVVIQIFGSWCPNCIDELNYLAPWYLKNRHRGVEIVALSFERALSRQEAMKHLKMVSKKREIPYPVLLAGTNAAETPQSKLPGIKNFIAFPTTIFLDRQHKVHKIHAGFNGPGTGSYYLEFQKFFEQTIDEITR